MRIDRLNVHNFKNFDDLTVDFIGGVNLFVGSNGSGKTSILEAINVALGGFFGSQEQKLQRPISFDEIKIVDGKRVLDTTVTASSALIEGSWSRTLRRDTKANDTKGIRPASEYGKQYFEKFELSDDQTDTPLIAFYSTQRLFNDSSASTHQKYDAANGRRNGYLQSLKPNAIKGVLDEWLGNAVTRRATLQIKAIDGIDLILENVESAVRQTLIYFLNLPENFSLKIYQDPDFNNQLFVNYDNEHNLPISYYSDGFRNLLYLVIDLVWRATQLNPWLSLAHLSDQVFGVVTIDEIDLHLHPKWQAKAIGILQRLFPNVQFFITTHSPTVVANFENGRLFVINQNQVTQPVAHFFGKQIDDVLRDILGAPDRHIPTQRKIEALFRSIDNKLPNEYEPLLGELTELLGEEDADIVKARALIDFYNFPDAE
jgi:predicted ATP-binding protein involved in virulence